MIEETETQNKAFIVTIIVFAIVIISINVFVTFF
ncbi:hypothetical protein Lacal_0720 [Lacinutrix sp. 5H-3-7-4]|nr:hypothetical protein Lacal_0720 [Lacinutrix sp. 5H-3-7-4]